MSQLMELFRTIQVAEPVGSGRLQVFGLRWAPGNDLGYTTLDEALAAQTLDVTEITEGGNVPTLMVVNKNDTMVFLMAGEQLIGAKQNRVLNTSILVPARSELPIPVTCVEAGRWGYRSRKFSSTGTSSHSMLRRQMAKETHSSLKSMGTPTANQGAVWREVDRKLCRMVSPSATHALEDAYVSHRDRLGELQQGLPAPEGCSGAVFVFGGHVAGLDLFDQPATLVKLWPKLVRGYALDALEEADKPTEPLGRDSVIEWLHKATGAKVEPFPSPGVGEDVRFEAEGLVGAGLVVDNHPVHVELFADA